MTIHILAGGSSTRMEGGDKAQIDFYQGMSMLEFLIERFAEKFGRKNVKIIARKRENYSDYNVEILEDICRAGPLGGIYTGLKNADRDCNFFMACDMPFLLPEMARWMLEKCSGDVLIPDNEEGLMEPLAAVYCRSCIPAIEARIETGEKQIIAFFNEVKVERVPPEKVQKLFGEPHLFYNINTRSELRRAREKVLPDYINRRDNFVREK